MALVILDGAALDGGAATRQGFARDLERVCRQEGFFLLRNHGIPAAVWKTILTKAEHFFAGPSDQKEALHLRNSTNFRGFSRMKNSRDWREQLHFGTEWPEGAWSKGRAEYYRLAGVNPWPSAPFAKGVLEYLTAVRVLGFRLLEVLGGRLGLPLKTFTGSTTEPPYLLLKAICYYAQPGTERRSGVAPHCDWSWITLLLQDQTGGLEVQSLDGKWRPVPAEPGVLAVNTGELLEVLTRGYFRAAPHRVVNPQDRPRISVPVFLNPALSARIEPLDEAPGPVWVSPSEAEHIHRVVPRGAVVEPFCFGESEWQRTGWGRWCHQAACLKS
jgi:isopenicillin N synthase-like dioxygenase